MKLPTRTIWTILVFAALLVSSALGQLPTPASELMAAYEDAKLQPVEIQPALLYLTLYSSPPEQRADEAKVTSYVLNHLSRTRSITPISRDNAPGNTCWISDTLARVVISSYDQSLTAWRTQCEKLGEFEPTWHLRTEIVDKIPVKPTKRGDPVTFTAETKIVTTYGGWVGLATASKMTAGIKANAPLMTARYFVANALQSPVYYDFVGLPSDEAGFYKYLGLDAKLVESLRANAGANLIESGVTKGPRRIVWSQGPLGGVWGTFDVEKRNDAARDPIRRPVTSGTLAFIHDVSEWFAIGPNGLFRHALFNAKGERQNTVPDKIAKDDQGDGIIYNSRSCITCHVEGLRPFADDQAKLLAKSEFKSLSQVDRDRVVEFYNEPRMKRQRDFDIETYTAACKLATGGMEPKQLSRALSRMVHEQVYASVTLEQAALECGVDVAEFKAATVKTRDPYLLVMLENRPILRGNWDSSFAEAITSCEARRTAASSVAKNPEAKK